MRIAEVDFPDDLIRSIDEGRLVVFAGAGVSMGAPARLPDFRQLATRIAQGTGKRPGKREPLDRFLGLLKSTGVDVEVRAKRMFGDTKSEPTQLHRQILRLFVRPDQVRIVTTNFDHLFEDAARNGGFESVQAYIAPALPPARNFRGIAHVHGVFDSPAGVVLTDEDFGRAYLTEGHTSRFLVDLFREFDILFVGYSHDDVVMTYLARALGDTDARKRFVLTLQGDLSKWQHLHIEPITYENPDHRHKRLALSLTELANILSRSPSDWQNRIHDLARKAPADLDQQALDEIAYALADLSRTRFFIESAASFDWIDWLDNKHHLDALFAQNHLKEREQALAYWVAGYAANEPEKVISIIARHGVQVAPEFWLQLVRIVTKDVDMALSDAHLYKWVSILIATMPNTQWSGFVETYLKLMVGNSIQRKLYDLAVKVFDALAADRIVPSPYIGIAGGRLTFEILGDHYQLNAIWTEHLKPNLEYVADDLLSRLYGRFTLRHVDMQIWQPMSGGLGTYSISRPSVGSDDSDSNQEPVNVLIDAARDCLIYLAEQTPGRAVPWFDLFSRSKAPLLRRIAVHALAHRADLTADEKADWLLANIGLGALAERHEAMMTMKAIYSGTSPAKREAIIDAIHALEDADGEADDQNV